MKLQLDRPIVFFDLETTGLNPTEDRIIEISCVKLMPDGSLDEPRTKRLNPGKPISAESSRITGITDEMLKDCPTFLQISKGLLDYLAGCDLGGFNIARFDLPMLTEEFKRIGKAFDPAAFQIVDAQRIYHKKEPRTLEAAYRFYCGKTLEGAHSAEADVLATVAVLLAQIERYDDLPVKTADIAQFCRDERFVDSAGRFHWQGEEASIAFGKKNGTLLRTLAVTDPGFLSWMISNDFPEDTKKICKEALKGRFPVKPTV